MSQPELRLTYPSLSAMRDAHFLLLKRFREEGGARDDSIPKSLLADTERFVREASLTGALLDRRTEQQEAQSILDSWVTRLYRAGQDPGDATLAEFNKDLAPELPSEACPYLGLDTFTDSRAKYFFGRQGLVDELIDKLKSLPVLAIVGPSGSGKSSLVLAGIVPRLREGALPGSEKWKYFDRIVPGSEPLRNLARLFPPDAGGRSEDQQVEAFRKGRSELAERLAGTSAPGRVLVIDQFEETFTLCQNTADRDAYQANLAVAAATPGNTIILTMRDDYVQHLNALEDFQPLFDRGMRVPGALTAGELREAIEKPAAIVGLKFEEGVVAALVSDLIGEQAALPLLQVTLQRLWEQRERNRVTMAAYRRIGGGRMALARAADEFFNSLIPQSQEIAREILCLLVRPGEGMLFAVARRIRRSDLYQIAAPKIIDPVLDKLVAARLVRLTKRESTTDAEVEIAHEALIRNWDKLMEWVRQSREKQEQLQQLERRAQEWVRLGRGRAGLLDEVSLKVFQNWLTTRQATGVGVAISQDVSGLIAHSKEEVDRLESKEKKVKRNLIAAAAGCSVFAIVAASAGVSANRGWRRAEASAAEARKSADVAASLTEEAVKSKTRAQNSELVVKGLNITLDGERQKLADANIKLSSKARLYDAGVLATRAKDAVPGAPDLALLLALNAARTTYDADHSVIQDAHDVLKEVLENPVSFVTLNTRAPVNRGIFSPNGRLIATAEQDGSVELWNSITGKLERTIQLERGPAHTVQFSTTGLLAIGGPQGVRLLNVTAKADGTAIPTATPVQAVAFSADNNALAMGEDSGAVRIRRLTEDYSDTFQSAGLTKIIGAAFSPNGRLLAAAGSLESAKGGRSVVVWNIADRSVQKTLVVPPPTAQDGIQAFEFSESGAALQLTTENGRRTNWNTSSWLITSTSDIDSEMDFDPRQYLRSDRGPSSPISRLPTLARAVAARLTLSVADTDRKHLRVQRRTLENVMDISPSSATFTPDGRYVLGTEDDELELRDVLSGELLFKEAYEGLARAVMSRDARTIVTAGKGLGILATGTQKPLAVLDAEQEYVAVSLTADASRIAGASEKTVRLWDVKARTLIKEWNLGGTAIAFSPTGNQLAVGTEDGDTFLLELNSSTPKKLNGQSDSQIDCVAFDRTGQRVASGGGDAGIRVWNVETGRVTLLESPEDVLSLAFSPSGEYLAAGGNDGIQLWTLASGHRTEIPVDDTDEYVGVAFSTDSDSVLWINDYGLTSASVFGDAALIRAAQVSLSRDFRTEDCQRYFPATGCPAIALGLSEVAAGNALARLGDRTAALARYNAARSVDPALSLEPDAQFERVWKTTSAQNDALLANLIRLEAVEAAGNGQLARAEELFKEANDKERNKYADPRRQALDARIDRLRSNARAGTVTRAEFIDGVRLLQDTPELQKSFITGIVQAHLTRNRPAEALQAIEAVSEPMASAPFWASTWNSICWQGSLYDAASEAAKYKNACELAVKVAPSPSNRDSRAVNRALLGDLAGAIEDFQAYIAGTSDKAKVAQRQRYVDALKDKRNPFTPEEIQNLRKTG